MGEKKIPRAFGFPLWERVPKRILNKILNDPRRPTPPSVWFTGALADLRVGSIASNCTGLNDKIVQIDPEYAYLGPHGRGKVLYDVMVTFRYSTCSARHCGVWLPLTYEEAEAYRLWVTQQPDTGGWGFAERYSQLKVLPDGTYHRETP